MRKIIYLLTALVAVLLMPAIAAAQGDDAPASCLSATAGEDTGRMAPTIEVNTQGQTRIVNQLSLEGVAGARTIITDAMRYHNHCGQDLTVQLIADSVAGDWDGFEVALWLTDAEGVSQALLDGDGALRFAAGTDEGPVQGSGAAVLVPAGEQVQVAVAITAASDAGQASMRWVATGS